MHTKKPDLEGLETFAGAVFHSAEWDHSVALEGKRIGVIGTGSTGMQITRALAPVAGRFKLFQRTPQWIFPLPNRRYTRVGQVAVPPVPGAQPRGVPRLAAHVRGDVRAGGHRARARGARRSAPLCRLHLRSVRDPELRRRFTPDYQPMCKRLVMGTGFYKLFERPNVELVDEGIHLVEPRGIVTRDGELHELDVIVLATGFDAHAFVRPMELIGPGGLRLSDVWEQEPHGYRSVALPGFPNVLMLIGPHSPFGNQSQFRVSETQQDFAMRVIDLWRSGEVDAMAPTREATDRFNAEHPRQPGADGVGDRLRQLVHRQGRHSERLAVPGQASPRHPAGAGARRLGRQPGPAARARQPIAVGAEPC